MTVFWIDSDLLIWAKDNPYRLGAPHSAVFWNTIEQGIQKGVIKMTSRNYKEITEGRSTEDELAKWLKLRRCPGICVSPSKEVQVLAKRIAEYVFAREDFIMRWKLDFSKGADSWLIAQAWADNAIVVTRETNLTPDAKKAKIPNLCRHFKVTCASMYDMLDQLPMLISDLG